MWLVNWKEQNERNDAESRSTTILLIQLLAHINKLYHNNAYSVRITSQCTRSSIKWKYCSNYPKNKIKYSFLYDWEYGITLKMVYNVKQTAKWKIEIEQRCVELLLLRGYWIKWQINIVYNVSECTTGNDFNHSLMHFVDQLRVLGQQMVDHSANVQGTFNNNANIKRV